MKRMRSVSLSSRRSRGSAQRMASGFATFPSPTEARRRQARGSSFWWASFTLCWGQGSCRSLSRRHRPHRRRCRLFAGTLWRHFSSTQPVMWHCDARHFFASRVGGKIHVFFSEGALVLSFPWAASAMLRAGLMRCEAFAGMLRPSPSLRSASSMSKIEREKWSESSKRSYAYYCAGTDYVDFFYICKKFSVKAVFTGEQKKESY